MHQVETPWIRYSFGGIGLLASLVMLGVSMLANFRYGYSLARTPTDGQAYGTAAAAADVLMALTPFFFFAAVDSWDQGKGRAVTQAVASFILWATCTSFALQAVVSHASANRLDAASVRTVTANTYGDVRKELDAARSERALIPTAKLRPEATVRADIAKHKVNPNWTWTTECTEIRGLKQREYCATYEQLNSDLGYAVQASKLDARIEALTAKSDKASEASATVVASEADPGAKTWALLAGMDLRTVQGLLTFAVAMLILLGAGLGPYSSFTMLQPRHRRMIVIDAETATRRDVKQATQELLALAPPKEKALPEIIVRPDPSPEARALLTAIDFPVKTLRGPKRQRDERYTALPWRFLLWLRAHDIEGEFETSKLQSIYAEYVQADHREPWDWRIVGKEITESLGRFNAGKRLIKNKETGITGTYFSIKLPPLDKLKEQLVKKGVLKEPEPPAGPRKRGSIVSFPLASSGAAPEPKTAPEKESGEKPTEPVAQAKRAVKLPKGFAHLQPDWGSMRALARAQKAAFQDRFFSKDRKQTNRFSRARGAA